MNKGFGLLEAVIALALWLLLSAGVFMVWHFSALSGTGKLERQNAFENARISMDALIMNFQMAKHITLDTDENDVLSRLTLRQRDPQGNLENYNIHFRTNTRRMYFGQPHGGNEFASGLAEIRIIYTHGKRMCITVITACDEPNEPIVLEGSVCVRHKFVTIVD
jgi:hypothetical protein